MSTCLPSTELLTLWPRLQFFSISLLFQCTPSLLETQWHILELANDEIKYSSSKLMMDDKLSFRSEIVIFILKKVGTYNSHLWKSKEQNVSVSDILL